VVSTKVHFSGVEGVPLQPLCVSRCICARCTHDAGRIPVRASLPAGGGCVGLVRSSDCALSRTGAAARRPRCRGWLEYSRRPTIDYSEDETWHIY
jgi:hypothetical protein